MEVVYLEIMYFSLIRVSDVDPFEKCLKKTFCDK